MTEMDKYASKILVVNFNAMVEGSNMFLIEKPKYPFLQLTASLPGNNFYQLDPFFNGFLDNPI